MMLHKNMLQSGFTVPAAIMLLVALVAVGESSAFAVNPRSDTTLSANGLDAKGLSTSAPALVEARSSIDDLATSATSAKLLNWGSLFGGYPNNNGGYRPPYNPYPGYYPNTGTGYYSNTGTGYYPYTGTGYYPQTQYPSTTSNSGGYYPYPNTYYQTGVGTNQLGSTGGYGGYGGNGGFRQYNGYQDFDYNGQRNRGYGYSRDTDRYGLPNNSRGSQYGGQYGSDRAYGYGYNRRD